jgi:hypothetical protein
MSAAHSYLEVVSECEFHVLKLYVVMCIHGISLVYTMIIYGVCHKYSSETAAMNQVMYVQGSYRQY